MTDEVKSLRAKQLAADPLIAELLDNMEAKLVDLWRASSEQRLREEAWHRLKAVEMLRSEIEALAVDGDISRWNRRLRNREP